MPRSRVTLLAWVVAIAFILGTILQWIDALNLVATPPDLPNANMVDRTTASSAYFQAIWPVFLWTNLLFAIGFLASVAFAFNVASAAGVTGGLPTFKSLVTGGGVIAAFASLMPIGAANGKVWLQYCDCGFRDTEVVSQIWAQLVAQDISDWSLRFASVTLALALVALVREARGGFISPLLSTWTYLTAIALVVPVVLATTEAVVPDIVNIFQTIVAVVMVPVWAVWLARSLDRFGAPAPA